MFSLGNSIKSKLALAAVVTAGALAVPSAASAVTASGCNVALDGADCPFVGGTGHNAATDTGGSTQFRVNTSPFATVICTNSRATVVTENPPSMDLSVTLQFASCTTSGLSASVTCTPSTVTLSSGGSGSAGGSLDLSQNNCTISIASGLCVIRASNTAGGQSVGISVTGANGSKSAQITAAVTGNTDSVTFSAAGGGCGLAGIPSSGTLTFSNSPNSGPIRYDEVPSTSPGLNIS